MIQDTSFMIQDIGVKAGCESYAKTWDAAASLMNRIERERQII